MKQKPLAIIMTLCACLISCIVSIIQGVGFGVFVKRFAVTALVFLLLGFIIQIFLNMGFKVEQEETEAQEEEQQENSDEDAEGSGPSENFEARDEENT